ncbi:unnamed protein product [Adineta ricciae]|uniref:EamA domain-containing protein n=1 Tax=Adineta ricciae TaxID=249248 RepID=A0A815G888_ADIRI|nr:unnamed protein product [Adineta ricciae]CAF1335238.1 unnamed protein product [Adineta ricciae]
MNDYQQQHSLIVPSTPINDITDIKDRRSSSFAVVIEPIIVATEEIPDIEVVNRPKSFPLSGILYGLLGCFLFVTATFTVKELGIDLLDALIIRFIIQLILLICFVISRRYSIWRGTFKEKCLQIVLCICNGLIFLGYFIGIRYLPFSDFTTLNFTRLLWTVTFGVLIYKEKPTVMIILAVVFTLFGVTFVAQPTFLFKQKIIIENTSSIDSTSVNYRKLGISLALITGLFSAINLLIFKQLLTLQLKPSVLILQHSLVFLLCMMFNQAYKYFLLDDITFFTTTIFQWKYWLAGLISLLQTLAVIAGNRSVKREPPSIVTIVSASEIIYAIVLQNLFTRNKSNIWVVIGSLMVISSVLLIGVHKFAQERKKKKNVENDKSEGNA